MSVCVLEHTTGQIGARAFYKHTLCTRMWKTVRVTRFRMSVHMTESAHMRHGTDCIIIHMLYLNVFYTAPDSDIAHSQRRPHRRRRRRRRHTPAIVRCDMACVRVRACCACYWRTMLLRVCCGHGCVRVLLNVQNNQQPASREPTRSRVCGATRTNAHMRA